MAAPASQYWGIWDKSNEQSRKEIDHAPWARFLGRYVQEEPTGEGTSVAYGKVSSDDKKALTAYIRSLTALDPRGYAKTEQMAYWINLYNALTVDLILRHYPVKSITKLGPWYSFGPWDQTITKVADQALSLNDIEHRILRPIWKDKRIHYVVNCASKGCPDLSKEAYTAARLKGMLADAARRFINQEKGVEFVDGRLVLSRIYEWYGSDFGSKEELFAHLRANAKERLGVRLKKYTGPVDYRYEWSLNDVKHPKK